MLSEGNLKALESHFDFGKNWESYSTLIDDAAIERAKEALLRLIPIEDIRGKTFLDIGSGSGLHSLCAAKLGAARIMAVDIDPVSVSTTRILLDEHVGDVDYAVAEKSVFDLNDGELGQFEVVYSWGVLHHTGDMYAAIKSAADRVKPGGLLAIALYRRTYLDWFWIREKRWYTSASPKWQYRARRFYDFFFRWARLLTGRRGSEGQRGMDYWHDLHDWLGGYPYEAILAPEVERELTRLGFAKERVFARGISLGIFGSGCDEYVYRRVPAA